jgi:hypothetical protein
MDLTAIADLMADLATWRATELAAAQDVEDADAHVIAMDVKFQEAKRRLICVTNKVNQIQRELADRVNAQTAPSAVMYLTDGSGNETTFT